MAKLSKSVSDFVRGRAKSRCEYCRSSEWLTGQQFHLDHIIPQSKGGSDELENLCLACAGCNGSKLHRVTAIDPETCEQVFLFHPRQQQWTEHFVWDLQGTQIIGKTAIGRATVLALKMNRPLSVAVRAEWVRIQRHPPKD